MLRYQEGLLRVHSCTNSHKLSVKFLLLMAGKNAIVCYPIKCLKPSVLASFDLRLEDTPFCEWTVYQLNTGKAIHWNRESISDCTFVFYGIFNVSTTWLIVIWFYYLTSLIIASYATQEDYTADSVTPLASLPLIINPEGALLCHSWLG